MCLAVLLHIYLTTSIKSSEKMLFEKQLDLFKNKEIGGL